MHSPGINGEGELRGQPDKPRFTWKKMAVKTECVCVCALYTALPIALYSGMKLSISV